MNRFHRLTYLCSHQSYPGAYDMYIPDAERRSRIFFLQDCRNKWAHADVCSFEEVYEIILKDVKS